MTKRFIVSVDDDVPALIREKQNERFMGYADGKGFVDWWSFLPSFWLLIDDSGRTTASQLSDDVHRIFGGRCLVIELQEGEGAWAGYGPEKMLGWLQRQWEKKPPHPGGLAQTGADGAR